MYQSSASFGPMLISHIIVSLYRLLALTNAYTLYRAALSHNIFGTENIQSKINNDDKTWLRRRVKTFHVVGWCFLIAEATYESILLWKTDVYDAQLEPISKLHVNMTLIKILANIVFFVLMASWIFTPMVYGSLCTYLQYEFKTTTNALLEMYEHNDSCTVDQIRTVNTNHHKTCELVARVSGIFGLHSAMNTLVSIGTLCLQIYMMIWEPDVSEDVRMRISLAFWVGEFLVLLMVDLLPATEVNNEVGRMTMLNCALT